MGNQLNCGCQEKNIIKQNSIEGISKNLQKYAMQNDLIFFPKATRQLLQKLFVLNQEHVSDKIITLERQKKTAQRDKIVQDLSRVDLEQFDEFCHITKKIQNNKLKAGIDYPKTQNSQNIYAKIGSKFAEQGEKCLKTKKIMLIGTIKCFNQSKGSDPTVKTNLSSAKSMLQMFMDKVQGLRIRYGCDCQVYLICPKKKVDQISKFVSYDMTMLSYEPNQPCFSSQNKIILYGNLVKFNEEEGDLVHFILTHPSLKNLQQQYDYINFCDLTNLASPAVNAAHIGYLNTQPNLHILASVKIPQNNTQMIKVKGNFIQGSNFQFGDILIKTQILKQMRNRNSNLYQMLATRIERRNSNDHPDSFYFSRLPQDILYKSFSQITKVPYLATNRIQYSNFCKRMLGIQNENENDIVEVCPSIIHGSAENIQQIIETLKKKAYNAGYPLIIMKSNSFQA